MQTDYPVDERIGRHGAVYGPSELDVTSAILEAAMRPGDLAILGVSADGEGKTVRRLTAAAAADPDAIIATIASTGGTQTLDGAELDGLIGGGRIFPPRNLTFTHDGHADWNATTGVVTGLDEYGREITEDIAIPNGAGAGAQSVTLTKIFSQVTSLFIPAQGGVGGTADLGTGTLLGPITARDARGIVRYDAARQLAENATEEYPVNEVIALVKKGRVWLEFETAMRDGDQVYVRLVVAGEEVVGSFRGSRDGTAAAPDAVPVIGMRVVGDSVENGGVILAVAEINLSGL